MNRECSRKPGNLSPRLLPGRDWVPDWDLSCTQVIWVPFALLTRPCSDELSKWSFPWQQLILRVPETGGNNHAGNRPEICSSWSQNESAWGDMESKRRGASHQSSSVPLPALFRETLSLYSLTHLAGLIMFLSRLWEMAYVHGSDFIFLSHRKP